MHPIGGGEYLPMALAKAGHHVIYCQSRYPNNDTALIMEKVVFYLGECIRDAKERLGYRRVILAGWSGGGSLALYYQRQAAHATVTCTPAGDPPNLQEANLIPADGMLLLAAHVSDARRLFDAIAHDNKELVEICSATHYYLGQREQLREAEQTCTHWLRRQGLTDL